MKQRRNERKQELEEDDTKDPDKLAIKKEEAKKEAGEDDGKGVPGNDPMVRTSVPFGGVINDIKRRAPWYLSDLRDGLDPQCLAATIFIYFAALSGTVAFGGLMGDKTKGLIGIPETLITSCFARCIFHLFAAQPLIIIG